MDYHNTRARLEALYEQYTDTRQVKQTLLAFDGKARTDVETAWLSTLSTFYADVALARATEVEFGPGKLWDGTSPIEMYNAALGGAYVVNLLYPDAPEHTREPLVALIDDGLITPLDWLYAWVDLPQNSTPNYVEITTHLMTHPHVRAEGWLQPPTAALELAPTAQAHAEWLLAMYVGTFSRAPESTGLQYWGQALATALAESETTIAAYKSVAADIAWAARHNGEWPDIANPANFVSHVYLQVLGREADPSGQQYWTETLESGAIPRSEFLAVFLNSALQSHGDAAYLQTRVAVAAHAARPEVSGPGTTPPDLAAILHNVTDLASALAAIETLSSHSQPNTEAPGAALDALWWPPEPASDPYADMAYAMLGSAALEPWSGIAPPLYYNDE